MNVMAQAHKDTRDHIAQSCNQWNYRKLFAAKLRQAHKVNKQMQEENAKKAAHKAWAIAHFQDCINGTVEHFEALGVNDYYIAIENNKQLHDYTLLTHKVEGDTSSPLGWANYKDAIKTHSRQADQYVIAYPGTCKLHAQTHLSRTIEFLQAQLDQIKAN
ncbi:hypothetical protein QGX21_gp058 [Pseudomonas phage phiPsa315]|uniref:Uncharacterized protein n=1 Tax=Pseudomonas phage phiPsa315 TaxID=1460363 RepID=A0A7G9V1V3_9CAUD|nr:hypothetical protein QGX21_gp058 [Pseudomonas phage phiPsa315]QNO00259.1 hypothetical protein phiPsa315_168 [Pseudomonas phage phiPsa315]